MTDSSMQNDDSLYITMHDDNLRDGTIVCILNAIRNIFRAIRHYSYINLGRCRVLLEFNKIL